MKISAVVLAKNEEKVIGRCLESLSFCDEIIVIDTGSTDNTVTIAKKYKAEVYHIEETDFSKIRNYGLEKATGKWILYVDSDEIVSKPLQDEIRSTVRSSDDRYIAYRLKRQNIYFHTYCWPYGEFLERLFMKKNLSGWYGRLHESAMVIGEIGTLQNILFHYSHRDLSSMLTKTIQWSDTEAQLRFATQHPQMTWWRFPRVMLSAFFDSYIRQGGWKVGTPGLIESMYQAFSMFITYAKLWEMQQKKVKRHS